MAESSSVTPAARNRTGHLLLGAALLYLTLLLVLVAGKREVMGHHGFLSDDSYLNLVVAQHLLQHGSYGVGGERIPATQDTLWRLLIAGCDWLCDDLASAPYLLGALIGALLLAALLRLGRRVDTGIACAALAVLLLVLGTGLPRDAVSGMSTVLAMLLVTLAFGRHVRSFAGTNTPLALGSALALGLAALVRVEFAAIWLALALHAVLLCLLWRGSPRSALAVVIRTINGLLLIGIILAPVIWWNMRVIGVPWPRIAAAPLALDAMSGGGASVPAQVAALAGEALRQGWGWMQAQAPLLQGSPERCFFWIGCGWLLADALRRPEARPLTGMLAVLLVPLVLAPLHPFVGTSSHFVLWRSLQPVEALLVAYGAWRLAQGIAAALARLAPTWPAGLRLAVPVLLIGALPVLNGVSRSVRMEVARRDLWRVALDERAQVKDALAATGAEGAVLVSDRPGWLLHSGHAGAVVDLSGQTTPQVLAFLDNAGAWDLDGLRRYVESRDAVAAVLWAPSAQQLAGALGGPSNPESAAGPLVCRLNSNGVP
jgi:hypothetical protein